MDLSMLEHALPEGSDEALRQIRTIVEMADQSLNLVQSMSARLRSPVLDVLGLWAAVAGEVDRFGTRAGVTVEVELGDVEPSMDGAVKTAVYRILQESLTNVARHAGASRLKVTVRGEDGEVRM